MHCNEYTHPVRHTYAEWQSYGEPEPDGKQPGDLHTITVVDGKRDVAADCHSLAYLVTHQHMFSLLQRIAKCQLHSIADGHPHGNTDRNSNTDSEPYCNQHC